MVPHKACFFMNRLPLFAAVLAAWLSAPAWAGSFTVGVETTDYLPISSGESDGGYSGYARELLDLFAAKYGHTFSYKTLPVARANNEFSIKRSLDFRFPDTANWAVDLKKGVAVVYSKALVTVIEGLLVAPANKGKGVASIRKLGTIRGYTPTPYFDQIKAGTMTVTEVNTVDSAIHMADVGRVDGVYMSPIVGNYIMTEVMRKPGTLVYDSSLPKSSNDFSLSTIAHPEVIKQMDEFLVKEKDTVAKLKAKYKIVEYGAAR